MSKHIVDLTNTKIKGEIYKVAKNFSEKKTCIRITNCLAEAIEVVNSEKERYYVYNSKGVIVYKKRKITTVKVNINQSICASGINVYTHINSTIPEMAYHGTLIIVDDRLYDDKYKVRTNDNYPTEYYCKMDDVKKYITSSIEI